MNVQIPPDLDPAIQKLILEGRFRDENEIVAEGLRLVLKQNLLEKEVQAGLDDLDSGNRM
jgi:Arc/MetJ-type ribon-helix-helix transcriptional regulator